MTLLLLVHLVVAALILIFQRSIGRRAFALAAVGPISTAVWALMNYGDATGGTARSQSIEWVPGLDLTLDFRLDSYAVLFLLVIGIAGSAIFWHASRYFEPGVRVSTFAATMTVFSGAMAGLVTANHLLTIFLFWELTTITSYLLIGFDDHLARARSAALHAALVTGAGGLAMLGGLILLARESGSFLLSGILAAPPAMSATTGMAWGLILVGITTKSAQFPFHGWLPGAMAAPTPASAFLHSATMVKAGIFLAGRLAPAATASTEWWRPAVLAIGFITMVLGGWQALRQTDLKLLLAFGTVSQLGFLFGLIASGSPGALYGGLALLLAHAAFKAALFMVVGTIDHEVGTRDLRALSGLRDSMPATFAVGLAAAASMAAIPLTFGFAAKEAAFDGLLSDGGMPIALAAVASALTVTYTGRFVRGAFGLHHPGVEPAFGSGVSLRSPLIAAPALLAIAGVVLGVAPGTTAQIVESATVGVTGVAGASKLVVWPGLVPAFGWSLVSLALGGLLLWQSVALDVAIGRVRSIASRLPDAADVFVRSLRGLLATADRTTGWIQNGSLPTYLSTILLVVVTVPAVAAVRGAIDLSFPHVGGPNEAILGILIVSSAIGLARVRDRFAAVILLGGVGYGVAGLFVIAGGPDLALTQLLVETLIIGFFALVFRHLPAGFAMPIRRRSRLLVSALVGLFVFAAGLAMTAADPDPLVATTYLDSSLPEAAGRNVVNVILVDFRGLDTLGEISVLALAVLGAAGLVLPVLRKRRETRA